MIEVIVSDNCPHCEEQIDIMKRSFFDDEYKVVKVGSAEFELRKGMVDAVPFVVVLDDEDSAVKYAGKGVHDGTRLRKIERGAFVPEEVGPLKGRVFNAAKAS